MRAGAGVCRCCCCCLQAPRLCQPQPILVACLAPTHPSTHPPACLQEFVTLPGVGHCPQDEAPQLVNPLILDWVKLVTPA